MQDYKIILTWEAIYDVTDIADYIEVNNKEPIKNSFLKGSFNNFLRYLTS